MLPFTRNLGSRAGVQLNFPLDNTEGFAIGNSNQAFATFGVFQRGRTDKAFQVTRSNYKRYLGASASLTLSALNEAYLHIYEAFRFGAALGVIARYEASDAVLSYITVDGAENATAGDVIGIHADFSLAAYNKDTQPVIMKIAHHERFNDGVNVEVHADAATGEAGSQTIDLGGAKAGASATGLANDATTYTASIVVNGGAAQPISVVGSTAQTLDDLINELSSLTGVTWAVEGGNLVATSQVDGGSIAITDTDLFSSLTDYVAINAEAQVEISVPSKLLTVRLVEVGTGKELFSFYGSLDETAVNDFNESIFLSDVVSQITDDVEIVVASGAQVEVDSLFYGKDNDSNNKTVSEDVDYYDAGSAALTSTEINAAINNLRYNEFEHRYFITAGDQNAVAVAGMANIAKEMNRPIIVDIPAGYTKAQAITWLNSLGGGMISSYVHVYWTPLKARDPLNGGKAVWGTSGMQVGYRCARNAQTDNNGIPPMNYPIAGKNYKVDRLNVTQLEFPTEDDLNDLADNGINPVIFEQYNTESGYVFADSLTNVRKESATKLIAVSDMSSQVDDWIAKFGKESLQLPMEDAIRIMSRFERELFEALQTAVWITPSVELGGASYEATVERNASRPFDRMDTNYALHYDGTLRAVYAQQTISR